jgi:hypothetical protein
MSALLNQDPKQVVAFVSEGLAYRRYEAPDLDPYVSRETLQEMDLDDLVLISLDMILMPMEPSIGSLRAPL